jgi:hypothetical protein
VRLGMKHVQVSFCLTLAAVFAPTTPYLNLVDPAIRATCIPSTEIVVATTDQHEVHAVVVDMPQRASLEYASPESWGSLPTSVRPYEQPPVMFQLAPYEQPPATPMLPLAMNAEIEGSN